MADELKEIFKRFFDGWEEAYVRRQVERFKRSFGEQVVDERKRRLRYIIQMAAELTEIRKTTTFATAFCEWSIAAVIEGDVGELRTYGIEMLSEEDFVSNVGPEQGKRYAAAFAKFRDICEEAILILDPKTPRGQV